MDEDATGIDLGPGYTQCHLGIPAYSIRHSGFNDNKSYSPTIIEWLIKIFWSKNRILYSAVVVVLVE